MFAINTAVKAKACARALEKFLANHGFDLAHGNALNAISAMAGFGNWNRFEKSLPSTTSGPVPSVLDIDFDKVVRVEVWGGAFEVDTDRYADVFQWLKDWENDANPYKGKHRKALKLMSLNEDSYSSETMTAEEFLDYKWNEKQECFFNSGGGTFKVFQSAPYQFAGDTVAAAVVREPVVLGFSGLDLDLEVMSAVYIDGDYHLLHSVDTEAAAWLPRWNSKDNPYDVDVPVVQLEYIDDNGLMHPKEIAGDAICSMRWDESKSVFRDAEGREYRFMTQQSVRPGSAGTRQAK